MAHHAIHVLKARRIPIIGRECLLRPRYESFWSVQRSIRYLMPRAEHPRLCGLGSKRLLSSTTKFPRFDSLSNIDPQLQKSLQDMNLETMTDVQHSTFEPILKGHDVMTRARTGTGKTVAFLLPTVQRILSTLQQNHEGKLAIHAKPKIHTLILSPTRELALQIETQIQLLIQHVIPPNPKRPISHQAFVGGMSKWKEIHRLNSRVPTILVATPGRLADHIRTTRFQQGTNNQGRFGHLLSKLKTLILDEADRYIEMEAETIQDILKMLPKKRQTLLFSATLPPSTIKFLEQTVRPSYLPIDCIEERTEPTSKLVKKTHVILDAETSMVRGIVEVIQHLVASNPDCKMLCFFPTTAMVSMFSHIFNFGLGSIVSEIHSKKTQAMRNKVSKQFRESTRGVLFSTDISARGVDYPNVTHVVQIGIPSNKESFIHRMGRTGRADNPGKGILVLTNVEQGFLRKLKGMDVPVNDELQEMVSEKSLSNSKIQSNLKPVLKSIETEENQGLANQTKETYQSLLGYYSTQLRLLGERDPVQVATFCNDFAKQAGLVEMPGLPPDRVHNLGLDGVDSIVVQAQWSRKRRINLEKKLGFYERQNLYNKKDKESEPFADRSTTNQ